MKYYCKNCGSILTTPFTENYAELCPHCVTDDGTHKIMERIPDYETPAQYEVRTGKPFPDNGVVWIGEIYVSDWEGKEKKTSWFQTNFDIAKKVKAEGKNIQIVIASPPVPPPDDWRPE